MEILSSWEDRYLRLDKLFFQFVFSQLYKVLFKRIENIPCLQGEEILVFWKLKYDWRSSEGSIIISNLRLSNPFHCVIMFTVIFYFNCKQFFIMFSELAVNQKLNES